MNDKLERKMTGKIPYRFSTKMWSTMHQAVWYFVSLPKTISEEIRENLKWQEEGWGRMKAFAEYGAFRWAR